jgi:hypothetical protein
MVVLAALALLDPDQHARAVDVAHLERHDLGDAQSSAVGRAQRGPVLRTRRRFEQPRHLLDTQHQRQLARLADERETAGEIGPVERHGEEEAQRRDRAVDAWRLEARLRLVHLEAAQVLGCGLVGGATEEGGEGLHIADIVMLRLGGEAAHGHVLDHALAQGGAGRRRRMDGHEALLSS